MGDPQSQRLRARLRQFPRVHALAHTVAVRWLEPMRRTLHPSRYKETYVNQALAGRQRPTTYLEIGVRDGVSLRAARADRKIAIDPCQLPTMSVLRRNEEFFKTTSDEFFDKHAPDVLSERSIDVALIDGLHEFRQVLRDVLNLERYMRPDGIIFLDDCNPGDARRAAPIREGGGPWNGDVWKIGPYLINERPDLHFATLDADQGVGLVTGFGGAPAPEPQESVVRRYKDLPYEYLDANRVASLNLVPPEHLAVILRRIGACEHLSR